MPHLPMGPGSIFTAPSPTLSAFGVSDSFDDRFPAFSGIVPPLSNPLPTFSTLPSPPSLAPFSARLSLDGGDLFIGDRFLIEDRFLLPERFASPFDEVLVGRSDDDLLLGGPGDDLLAGGAGDDVLAGGDGADRFIFLAGGGRDVVTDFDADGTVEIVQARPSFFPAAAALDGGRGEPALIDAFADPAGADDQATIVRPAGEAPPIVATLDDGILLTFADGDSLTLLGTTGAVTVDDLALA